MICALFPSGQNVQPLIYVETAARLLLPQGPLLLSGITLSSPSSSPALCADLMHWNLCVTQRSHLEDRATVCELWWRVCWPAAMQTMPYSLIFRGHGLRETRRGGVMVSRFLPWKQQCGQHVSVFLKEWCVGQLQEGGSQASLFPFCPARHWWPVDPVFNVVLSSGYCF